MMSNAAAARLLNVGEGSVDRAKRGLGQDSSRRVCQPPSWKVSTTGIAPIGAIPDARVRGTVQRISHQLVRFPTRQPARGTARRTHGPRTFCKICKRFNCVMRRALIFRERGDLGGSGNGNICTLNRPHQLGGAVSLNCFGSLNRALAYVQHLRRIGIGHRANWRYVGARTLTHICQLPRHHGADLVAGFGPWLAPETFRGWHGLRSFHCAPDGFNLARQRASGEGRWRAS